ncbi:MAG TPA: ComEA family DNA-binding protein [Pseudonocardiaceae bacterium]|jgi:competence protein ComEA|nr:ComEA family DNA-binding protein [Pseudonocardiaceae bacterium]
MTRAKHPNHNGNNRTGNSHTRDRLAVLIGELAPEAATTPREPTESTPIFRWPDSSTGDQHDTVVDIDVDLPTSQHAQQHRPAHDPQGHNTAQEGAADAISDDTWPHNSWQGKSWLAEENSAVTPIDADLPLIDSASGDPPTRAPTPLIPGSAGVAGELSNGLAGQLVERWLPGGNRAVDGARTMMRRHRGAVFVLALLAMAAAIGTAIAIASSRPTAESAPALPPAISAMANSSAAPSSSPNTPIVISVVGKVADPGLVTLPDGSRVADAARAAGGVLPGTDVTALNLARKLADGEQIYVGIPIPPDAVDSAPDAATDNAPSTAGDGGADLPAKTSKKGKSGATLAPGQKVNLNTATADQLETLPGVGVATAQRIVDWRSQHGSFNSIDQLRDVGGIGDAKFAKLKDWVTV